MDDMIGKLTAEQALEIVERLAGKGGKIREAVMTEAMNVLIEIDLDGTADEVFVVLDSIDVQDCWDRSASSRDRYASPDEAAAEPAYIAFDGKAGGGFAFGCVTGSLHCRPTSSGLDFTWEGNDEMDEASGDGWVKLQKDGSLKGEIRFHNGDDSTFKARRW